MLPFKLPYTFKQVKEFMQIGLNFGKLKKSLLTLTALEPSVRAAALMSCPCLACFIRKTHKISDAFLLTTSLSPSGRQDSEVRRSYSLGESRFRSYIIRVVTLASPTVKKALLEVEPSHLHYELLSGGANIWEKPYRKSRYLNSKSDSL